MTQAPASLLKTTIRVPLGDVVAAPPPPHQTGLVRSPPWGTANTTCDAGRDGPLSLLSNDDADRELSDCRACSARAHHGLCAECPLDKPCALRRHKSAERELKAGQDLFSLGEPCDSIYNLNKGWVMLYHLSLDGRRQILHFALPGAVLGYHPAGGAMMTFGAQALTDIAVTAVPHKALPGIVDQQHQLGLRLAWLVARDRALALDHVASLARHSARERVAHLLLNLFVRYRAQWPGSQIEEMHLPLTQEHIGDATGLTFVHVNRVLRDLRKDGILQFHYRRLRILDPDRLLDVAGLDPSLVMSWIR